jgi:hypothetical protein
MQLLSIDVLRIDKLVLQAKNFEWKWTNTYTNSSTQCRQNAHKMFTNYQFNFDQGWSKLFIARGNYWNCPIFHLLFRIQFQLFGPKKWLHESSSRMETTVRTCEHIVHPFFQKSIIDIGYSCETMMAQLQLNQKSDPMHISQFVIQKRLSEITVVESSIQSGYVYVWYERKSYKGL